MKKPNRVGMAVLAVIMPALALAQSEQPKRVQKFDVETKVCESFIEKLEENLGVAIGHRLTEKDMEEYNRFYRGLENTDRDGSFHVIGLKKRMPFFLMHTCYVAHGTSDVLQVSGYRVKADKRLCTEAGFLEKLCEWGGLAYDGDAGVDGFSVHDKTVGRSISVVVERTPGTSYVVTVRCDDVRKFVLQKEVDAEIVRKKVLKEREEAERVYRKECEEAERKAEEAELAERVAAERAVAKLDAAKTKMFKDAILYSLANGRTDIENIGVDFPVKSLCGFRLGASVKEFKNLVGGCKLESGNNGLTYKGKLAKPFRLFTNVSLSISKWAGLWNVRFSSEEINGENYTYEDMEKEVAIVVAMLEKKFGIKLNHNPKDTHATWYEYQEITPGMRRVWDDNVNPDDPYASLSSMAVKGNTLIESVYVTFSDRKLELQFGSAFIAGYGDLLRWRVNHKKIASDNEGFDVL